MANLFTGARDVYVELADRFEGYIRSGIYRGGDRLPSVRHVGEEFGVNPNTVAKSYTLLEERGLVVTVPKKGVFVSFDGEEIFSRATARDGQAQQVREEKRRESVDSELHSVLQTWRARGVTRERLMSVIKEVFEKDDSNY